MHEDRVEESYRPRVGDLVWYLPPCTSPTKWPWWPALVIDPSESSLDESKRKPLAYVRFHDGSEDVVFRLANVHPFSCEMRKQFVKQGKESKFSEDFCKAVASAEKMEKKTVCDVIDDEAYTLNSVTTNGGPADDTDTFSTRSDTPCSSASFVAVDDEISFRSPKQPVKLEVEERGSKRPSDASDVTAPVKRSRRSSDLETPTLKRSPREHASSQAVATMDFLQGFLKQSPKGTSTEQFHSLVQLRMNRFQKHSAAPSKQGHVTVKRHKARSLSPAGSRISPRAHASTRALRTQCDVGVSRAVVSRVQTAANLGHVASEVGHSRKSPRQHASTAALLALSGRPTQLTHSVSTGNVRVVSVTSRLSPRGHVSTICRIKNPQEFGVAQKATVPPSPKQPAANKAPDAMKRAVETEKKKSPKKQTVSTVLSNEEVFYNLADTAPDPEENVKYVIAPSSSQQRTPHTTTPYTSTKPRATKPSHGAKTVRLKVSSGRPPLLTSGPKQQSSTAGKRFKFASTHTQKASQLVRAAASLLRARRSPRELPSSRALRAAAQTAAPPAGDLTQQTDLEVLNEKGGFGVGALLDDLDKDIRSNDRLPGGRGKRRQKSCTGRRAAWRRFPARTV